jgi:hypothetical protein
MDYCRIFVCLCGWKRTTNSARVFTRSSLGVCVVGNEPPSQLFCKGWPKSVCCVWEQTPRQRRVLPAATKRRASVVVPVRLIAIPWRDRPFPSACTNITPTCSTIAFERNVQRRVVIMASILTRGWDRLVPQPVRVQQRDGSLLRRGGEQMSQLQAVPWGGGRKGAGWQFLQQRVGKHGPVRCARDVEPAYVQAQLLLQHSLVCAKGARASKCYGNHFGR